MTTTSQNLRGIASMVIAAGTFVANDSCMKLALADTPPFQVLAMRGLSALLWCLPLVLIMGLGRELPHIANRWVVLRASGEMVAVLIFVVALSHMPIADLTAIMQTTPLIVVVAAALLWREAIGPLRALLIGLGIVGALMVAQPGSSVASPYALLGFVAATGAALRDILTRRVNGAIPGLIVALSTIIVVMLGGLVLSLLVETPVMPSGRVVLLLLVAGFFVMCGQIFVFLAFRFAPPRIIAPFFYTFTVWAVLSGLVVFHDRPNALAIAGMVLIVVSGLAVILHERYTRNGEAPV